MTRETKIGLLVGLAFIIVIGILLSDHFRATMEPAQAALTDAANTVRKAVSTPGSSNPPITIVAPTDAPPRQVVPTHEDLNPPVTVKAPVAVNAPPSSLNPQPQNNQVATNSTTLSELPPTAGADGPGIGSEELNRIAARHGEQIVQLNTTSGNITPAAVKSYTAQAGDSVSRMASRLMGADNKANRQAIINANPSLQDDPDMVAVGKIYMIPSPAAAQSGSAQADNNNPQPPVVPTKPVASNTQTPTGYTYTVQEGDSLWRIANDQLGDPSAVDAIKSLNTSLLKGPDHDIIPVGAKLRLPSKPVASAN